MDQVSLDPDETSVLVSLLVIPGGYLTETLVCLVQVPGGSQASGSKSHANIPNCKKQLRRRLESSMRRAFVQEGGFVPEIREGI